MPKIHVLDKHTAELIAAGEVVERPSSVVKELMENAIDAKSSTITVEIQNGGVTSLLVRDDGCGMERDDVPTAFLRHATSKVRTETDLDAIGTLGFRGEALASIAAVSRVELITRRDEDMAGTRYVMEGGEPVAMEDVGCARGSTIIVRDLFYNVPARMKFLKKDVSEANAVTGVVERLALSHPEISFRFLRDGREELLTPGDGDMRSCIYAVFGKAFSDTLMPLHYTLGGITVDGFVNKPAASRANRTMQHFFINGRYVKTRTAMAALEQAYKGSIMVGKFPACVMYLTMPPETVDANVHPAKIEVRFINEKPVFDAVYHGVKTSLEKEDTPKQATITGTPKITLPTPEQTKLTDMVRPPVKTPMQMAEKQAAVQQEFVAAISPTEPPVKAVVPAETKPLFRKRAFGEETPSVSQTLHDGTQEPYTAVKPHATAVYEVSAQPVQSPYSAEPVKSTRFLDIVCDEPIPVEASKTEKVSTIEEHPPIQYLGEAFHTYILVQTGETICFIDKHAAHERLLYNQLKSGHENRSQMLLAAEPVALGREEYAALSANSDLLQSAGFEVEDFGDGTLLVRAVPMMLSGEDVQSLMQEIAGGLLSGRREVMVDKLDWIYHSTACRAAIKAGNVSSPQELQKLAERVLSHQDIRYCPHGRPVVFELTRKEIEKQFGRIV